MRLMVLLSVLIILNDSYASGQWIEKSSWPETGLIRLNVVNDSTLFATGEDLGSYILKSSNSGVDWDTTSFQNAWLFDIQFLNDSIGFIGGQADFMTGPTYFKTADGGQSWQPMNFAAGGGLPYHSLFFISKDTGFASSGFALYKTTNGGDSFDLVPVSDSFYFLATVYFKNDQEGFVTAWEHVTNQTFRYRVFQTPDQGLSWTSVYSEVLTHDASFGFTEMIFSTQQIGFISGFRGFYLRSADGGNTWAKIPMPGNQLISGFDFVSADTGYAVSDMALIKTTDGGMTWQTSPTPAGAEVTDVQFLNAGVGYISGSKVCKTTTGTNKIEQRLPAELALAIYPNPTKNTIHLEYLHLKIHRLTLTDLSGRMIKNFRPESKTLDVSGIAAGIYFLQVKAREGELAEKVEIK